MGTDNLNRVFIKAYGKGGASSAAGKDSAANQDPLMVRFDTATVQIPAPHMLAPPRQPSRPVAAPIAAPQPAQPAQVAQHVAASALSGVSAESELTAWDETMMSILFGGSTMVAPSTSIHSARRPSPSTQRLSAEPAPQSVRPDRQVGQQTERQFEPHTETQPEPKLTQLPRPDVSDGKPLTGASATPTTAVPNFSASASTFSGINVASPNFAAAGPSAAGPSAADRVVAGPQNSNSNATAASNSGALEKSKSDLTQKIAAMNRGGGIFRLDRPSYAGSARTVNSPVVEDHHEADDSSQTALDLDLQRAMEPKQTPPVTPPVARPMAAAAANTAAPPETPRIERLGSKQDRSRDKTKRREQGLRQARIKIFNPLWEVDRLEWPAVCAELSRTIDEGSAGVVENLLRACQAGLQVLAVTSPQSGEGTSTVACCLAMLAGKHGLNIALVDSNIENPSLSYQTNLDLEVDWNDAVSKRIPLEEIAVHSVDDQVTLVPLLERLNAPELNEQNVAMMLQELSQSFDLVIVDLGNMSTQQNLVRKLGELGVINAVVAVVDRRLSSPERIEMCLRQIRQTGIASIGLVENFAA